MEYGLRPGMQRDIANGRPYKRFVPTNYTVNAFNQAIDSRYDKTFKTVFFSNRPGTYTINGRSITLSQGDTTIWLPGRELSESVINSKRFTVVTPSRYTDQLFPGNVKFLAPLRPDVSATAARATFWSTGWPKHT